MNYVIQIPKVLVQKCMLRTRECDYLNGARKKTYHSLRVVGTTLISLAIESYPHSSFTVVDYLTVA